MDDVALGPQRMRYSFESRCRAVAAMVAGLSPGVASQAIGASRATGYRWWRRYVTAGWVGLQERPSTPQHQPRRLSPAAEAEILAARRHSGAGPVTLGALLGRDRPFASVHAALTKPVSPGSSTSPAALLMGDSLASTRWVDRRPFARPPLPRLFRTGARAWA